MIIVLFLMILFIVLFCEQEGRVCMGAILFGAIIGCIAGFLIAGLLTAMLEDETKEVKTVSFVPAGAEVIIMPDKKDFLQAEETCADTKRTAYTIRHHSCTTKYFLHTTKMESVVDGIKVNYKIKE